MSVDTWGTGDILIMLAVAALVVSTVAWWVPAIAKPVKREYDDEAIHSYDRHVVSYFVAAALALVVGAIHMVVKNLPGVSTWLWEAGYGGHLVRDLANSHIIIVGCGTVLLSGITCYALPRLLGRPLFSTTLANASLRFTVIGVFGFYLSWVVLGIIEGQMVRNGWTYPAAKAHLGAWHTAPARATSMLLGIGYWTFVLNVCLTAMMARAVRTKPAAVYAKFIVVAAVALFIGTVQGVVQVLPAAADWIHAAGKFGEFVDPISHAHINLVTGMVVALAGLVVWMSDRLGNPVGPAEGRRLFWTLVPSSITFYLAFLLIGLVQGGKVVGHGGIQAPWLSTQLDRYQDVVLATAAALMLASFWVYIQTVWQIVPPANFRSLGRAGSSGALWLASTFALLIGTFQGLMQAIPGIKERLIVVEEVPNVHAQLNMIGGVLLALIGLVVVIVPDLTGKPLPALTIRRTLIGVGGGIACTWAVTVVAGLARAERLRRGATDAQSWSQLGLLPPVLLTLSSAAVVWGAWGFARGIWAVAEQHRVDARVARRTRSQRVAGPIPQRVTRFGGPWPIAIEFVGGLAGWPGAGWLATGRILVGLPLLLIGPMIAWAIMPMLFSPFTGSFLSHTGWVSLLVWLAATATLSSLWLGIAMHRTTTRRQRAAIEPGRRRGRWQRRLIGAGAGLMVITLASALAIPAIVGVAQPANTQRRQPEIADEATGVYVKVGTATGVGYVSLFEWSFLLDAVPAETPIVGSDEIRSIVVADRGTVEPERYHMFALDSGRAVTFVASGGKAGESLVLSPTTTLRAGAYLIDVPNAGGWGRSYYYLVIASGTS